MERKHMKQGILLGVLIMLMIFYCTSAVEEGLTKKGNCGDENASYPQMYTPYEWEKTYGGNQDDHCLSIRQANNGGYILAGYTYSDAKGNDAWLMKIDEDGTVIWEKKYGSYTDDYIYCVESTGDGYIAVGKTFSYSYNNSFMGWLIKVNEDGEKEWEKILGGKGDDCFLSIHRTTDGGFILGGYTKSSGAGDADIWLLKLDENWEKDWENIWGGAKWDQANDIRQTSDEGYITLFYYDSFGFGDDDDWLYKINVSGIKEWQRTFGGVGRDILSQIMETDDGFVIAGSTESFGSGKFDVWIIKTDEEGRLLWNKTFGGGGNDYGYYVEQTDDGYIVVGSTESFGSGGSDAWVIKTDREGNLKWNATFGGEGDDCFNSIQKAEDGGFVIAGSTESFGSGGSDAWVIKIFVNEFPYVLNISGPTNGFQWVKYTYNVSAIDPDGNKIKFYFDWGDGSFNWTNFVNSGDTISKSHIWENAGTYEVKVKAQDENGGESEWSFVQVVISQNSKPDKPDKPQGPTSGMPGSKYAYSTLAYDEDGDMIQYGWDWNGDGTVDEWTSFYSSGEVVEVQHSWDEQGDYEVKVIGKDEHGAKGEWSDPIVISIPYCLLKKFIELPLISFLRDLLLHFYIIY